MAFTGEYKCSKCGSTPGNPDLLVAKKVMFQELGTNPRTLKSRTVDWLCPPCVAKDPDWKKEPYTSPGMIDPDQQKVPSG